MELTLQKISKKYKEKTVIYPLDFTFHEGIYGLLGPNGSGKSTLIRMLCDILKPNTGTILYNDESIEKLKDSYREVLGYLPQDFGYYPKFTAWDFMIYLAMIKGLQRSEAKTKSEELLRLVDLYDVKNKKIKTFSGGMKQRLGIAQVLLNDPKVMILDEPTAGLDPKERNRFKNILATLSKNRIILVSTHIVSDVESITDQIIILEQGKINRYGNRKTLIQDIEGCIYSMDIPCEELESSLQQHHIINVVSIENGYRLRFFSQEPQLDATAEVATLEDLYLSIFGYEYAL